MPRTVRKVAQEWEQGFTDTIPKEAGAAGSGEASVAARPAGPELWNKPRKIMLHLLLGRK